MFVPGPVPISDPTLIAMSYSKIWSHSISPFSAFLVWVTWSCIPSSSRWSRRHWHTPFVGWMMRKPKSILVWVREAHELHMFCAKTVRPLHFERPWKTEVNFLFRLVIYACMLFDCKYWLPTRFEAKCQQRRAVLFAGCWTSLSWLSSVFSSSLAFSAMLPTRKHACSVGDSTVLLGWGWSTSHHFRCAAPGHICCTWPF